MRSLEFDAVVIGTGCAGYNAADWLYDFGVKNSQLKFLAEQGMDLCIVPATFTAEQVKATGAEAVFLSSGPGDPAALKDVIAEVAKLAETMPMAGVGLGHQVLALALGASPAEAAALGNMVASVTIRKIGETGTASPEELLALFN